MSEETLVGQLAEDRERLRLAREERVHPGRDDKVLAAWNSLAIKSLALGGAILEQPQYMEAAQRAAEFLFEKMTGEEIARILTAVNHPHIAALYDYGNSMMVLEDPLDALDHMAPWSRSGHLKDHVMIRGEDSGNGRVDVAALDRTRQSVRIRPGATVVRVEHAQSAADGEFVRVAYEKDGAPYQLKARAVVMASGGGMSRAVLADMPDDIRQAYASFQHAPGLWPASAYS